MNRISTSLKYHSVPILVSILVAGTILRLLCFGHYLVGADASVYFHNALEFYRTGSFLSFDMRAVSYYVIIAFCVLLFGSPTFLMIKAISLIPSILILPLVYLVGRSAFGVPCAILATLIACVHPLLIQYGHYAGPDILEPFLLLLILYLYRSTMNTRRAVILSFLLGFLLFLRASAVILILILTSHMIWCARGKHLIRDEEGYNATLFCLLNVGSVLLFSVSVSMLGWLFGNAWSVREEHVSALLKTLSSLSLTHIGIYVIVHLRQIVSEIPNPPHYFLAWQLVPIGLILAGVLFSLWQARGRLISVTFIAYLLLTSFYIVGSIKNGAFEAAYERYVLVMVPLGILLISNAIMKISTWTQMLPLDYGRKALATTVSAGCVLILTLPLGKISLGHLMEIRSGRDCFSSPRLSICMKDYPQVISRPDLLKTITQPKTHTAKRLFLAAPHPYEAFFDHLDGDYEGYHIRTMVLPYFEKADGLDFWLDYWIIRLFQNLGSAEFQQKIVILSDEDQERFPWLFERLNMKPVQRLSHEGFWLTFFEVDGERPFQKGIPQFVFGPVGERKDLWGGLRLERESSLRK